jgi:hypothetical protein
LVEIGLLNIGRVLARALALLDRKAPADQKRIAIAQATAGIRYASAVLFSRHRNSYGSCRQKRLRRFRRTSKKGLLSAEGV